MNIAAAYIRVSSDDQLEYSPESQLKLIREAAQRDDMFIPDDLVFSDDGISGRSAEKRPAFRLMIAQAKQDPAPFEAVYVWKYSRFARNQEEAILYKNLLRKRGIAVKSISEPSSDSPFSSLIERIIEWMDEYYLINLSEEVKRGLQEKASRGEPVGLTPFGYKIENKKLVPREDEAEIVRYIFEQYAAGANVRSISADLAARGIKTRRGSLPNNVFCRYILKNPCYIGNLRYSKEGKVNYRSIKDYSAVSVVENAHEAIISRELWNAVQERIKAGEIEPKYVRPGVEVNMLKGLLRCSTLTVHQARTAHGFGPSLQCCSYAAGNCRVSHSLMLWKAEAAVIEGLREIIGSGSFVFAPRPAPKAKQLSRDWDKLIEAETSKLARAQEAYLSGAFDVDEYARIKAELTSGIEKLRSAQEAEKGGAAQPEPDRAVFAEKARSVLAVLESPDVSGEAKNTALRSIIDKIVYRKDPKGFDFYFRA